MEHYHAAGVMPTAVYEARRNALFAASVKRETVTDQGTAEHDTPTDDVPQPDQPATLTDVEQSHPIRERLILLDSLLSDGLVTEAEYEAHRAAILDSL